MVYIIHKPGPDLYTVDWLFQNNHRENRDHEIPGMDINKHAMSTSMNIPVCTSTEDIHAAT